MSYKYKVDVSGVEYLDDEIKSANIINALFDKLSVGNACSSEFSITFWPKAPIPRMAELTPYIYHENVWRKLGVFYVDARRYVGDTVELVAYDSMLKADVIWEPEQSLEFPMSMKTAVNVIAALMGVTVDPRTNLSETYTIDYPANDYTLRDVLGYIAAAHGGNWVITANDQLLLVPLFSSMPDETNYLVSENGDVVLIGGVRIIV